MVIRHEASPFGTVESAERLVIAEVGALAAALLDSAMQPLSCLKVKFQSVGLFFLRIHGKFEGKSVVSVEKLIRVQCMFVSENATAQIYQGLYLIDRWRTWNIRCLKRDFDSIS